MSLRGRLGGRSRRRDLALGRFGDVSQYLVVLRGAWMTDDKQPAHNCERMNGERERRLHRSSRRRLSSKVPRA